MMSASIQGVNVVGLDAETAELVRLAAVVTAGSETQLRDAMSKVVGKVRPVWVEELLLQSYLFSGFPRTLNAMREWRKASGEEAPRTDEGTHHALTDHWRSRGEATCGVVYGDKYESLRKNIRALHPALDSWMIIEGYGKVLSRSGLDLVRRELCIVAACAAAGQTRQLHSHLHGAVNAGASAGQVEGTLAAIAELVGSEMTSNAKSLWSKVSSGKSGAS
jgi:4-carboxymuconolactone decarboxylase